MLKIRVKEVILLQLVKIIFKANPSYFSFIESNTITLFLVASVKDVIYNRGLSIVEIFLNINIPFRNTVTMWKVLCHWPFMLKAS